ncbi:MAG: flagellar hook-basal body complex protein [Sulfurimonas sp.]|nr:flagellar hook-basal body complex protein [Sulfurimonas sp.]
MSQAFYTGISGIRSNQYAIDVVSNNMANVSTVGFRGSNYEFASLFEEQLSTATSVASSSIGLGSRLQATSMVDGQGVLQLTDRSTDLAILGDGWFGIQGEGDPVYTRDGAFTFDANDDLVSLDGLHVLGTLGGNISDNDVLTSTIDEIPLGPIASQEKLKFPKSLTFPPVATSLATFSGNLGNLDEVRTMSAGVVDSQSNKNELKLTFTRTVPQVLPGSQWDVVATTETLDGNTIYDTKNGQALFGASGDLISSTLTSIDNNGTNLEIDLGSGFDGVVALSNTDVYASSSANGTIGGDLRGYSINKNGEVIATFTNGAQSSVGKIAIYHFQNEQGLTRLNGSKFQASQNSGEPLFYTDAAGNNIIGTDLTNFNLEGSNIDLSYGLTDLIILQRSYDANSKSITTADQMMQKALSMDA